MNAPHHHKPGKKCHRTLAILSRGERSLGEIRATLGIVASSSAGRKFWRLVGALVRDGFVVSDCGTYRITDKGVDALERLDAGQAVPAGTWDPPEVAGSIRVFVDRRAA